MGLDSSIGFHDKKNIEPLNSEMISTKTFIIRNSLFDLPAMPLRLFSRTPPSEEKPTVIAFELIVMHGRRVFDIQYFLGS